MVSNIHRATKITEDDPSTWYQFYTSHINPNSLIEVINSSDFLIAISSFDCFRNNPVTAIETENNPVTAILFRKQSKLAFCKVSFVSCFNVNLYKEFAVHMARILSTFVLLDSKSIQTNLWSRPHSWCLSSVIAGRSTNAYEVSIVIFLVKTKWHCTLIWKNNVVFLVYNVSLITKYLFYCLLLFYTFTSLHL